jgi:transposase
VGQEERVGTHFQCVGRKSRLRISHHRLHHRARPPACGRRKRGSEDEAIGRSRGGLSTKISVGVDALGNPVRFILTGGQANDILQAEDLISGISFEHLLADKGYDANWLRVRVAAVGAEAVIPSTRSRSQAIPYDKHIYQERNLVERFFNKIKHFRRIATRYEKTAISFAAMLFLVGATIWLR